MSYMHIYQINYATCNWLADVSEKAVETAPSVILVDDIDSIEKQTSLYGTQTFNQLMKEMDE